MAKKYGPIRGLTGDSFLRYADGYLQNAAYRKKLEKVCEKYGVTPRLEPGLDHILMWAELGGALAEEHEGLGVPSGRPPLGDDERSSDEIMAQFVEANIAEGFGKTPAEVLRKWQQMLKVKKRPREKLSELQIRLQCLSLKTLQEKASRGRKALQARKLSSKNKRLPGYLNDPSLRKKRR